ncbi:4Fe-4S dicluster protein [Thermoflavifilum aggregans]|uniref:4Fe-4S dicluster protein n=1 Tax=Thermoflavifilum aggregans TaxID=454188 RepID=A0A2M9CV35_9BACT|nr:(Fe-S)-binding protein [Thermoflavifilum aggregans]PJJ75772.1 4Fe-4S dicluster protein [Thermoflavifilum aggregans]
MLIAQIVFIALLVIAITLFSRQVRKIRRNILLGRDEQISGNRWKRWKNVLLLAFGQKKMFRNWIPAILHLFVYLGFIIINLEILEIILDGILGTHRLFLPYIKPVYPAFISAFEVLAVLVILACSIFLIRRNILHVRRFENPEMTCWPRRDANNILIFEIILMLLFLTMNASDQALQMKHYGHYYPTGSFLITHPIAQHLQQISPGLLVGLERGSWWLHIAGVLFFLNYLPYSKHFHILLAFPNTYYASLEPKSQMPLMADIVPEVRSMMGLEADDSQSAPASPPVHFGARDVFDLSWRHLLAAYSCTECGRCTAACPANQTGKKLSPRKIMMDTRDRLEEIGRNIDMHGSFVDDGKSLLNYISEEELRACTTCQACVEECPVSISPLAIILELRRYLVMEASSTPQEWNAMFTSIENNGAPWTFPPDERGQWASRLA